MLKTCRVSSVIRYLSSEIKHSFWKIHKHEGLSNNLCSVPTDHSLLACVCLFLCGRVSFVVEGRRCVLFDAYATLSPWKDLDAVVYTNAR